ncbi:hypothetical protein [Nocardia colli]|uniref:hypothetical protein n=1 Tax=Nocardia colli TaxID=2545717 RepID=UPI00168D0CBD|nr:hypothetical protein [Nocardia colli]
MATVGISAERTVVRGVLLIGEFVADARPHLLREVSEQVDDGPATTAIVAVLDRLTGDAELPIDDVAVLYRTADERRALVTFLASRKWQSASLVSIRSALLAVVQDMPGLETFDHVLAVEALGDRTCCAIIGPDRARILAADSWPSGVQDAESAGRAVGHVWPMLDAISVRPDVVVLCGAAAAEPEIATVLHNAFGAPVRRLPDFSNTTARGAALVAAEHIRNLPIPTPREHRRPRRLVLSAAALIALLGASGFTVAQLHTERPPVAHVLDASAKPTTPEPITADPPPPSRLPDTSQPDEPTWTPPVVRPPARTTDRVEPPTSSTTPEPSAPPPSTTVGAPSANWLFPGESPPPPAGSDPAVVRAWWDNHLLLKERWLNGG